MEDKLIIRGARENNLKNINIDIPKNKLVIMTGFLVQENFSCF